MKSSLRLATDPKVSLIRSLFFLLSITGAPLWTKMCISGWRQFIYYKTYWSFEQCHQLFLQNLPPRSVAPGHHNLPLAVCFGIPGDWAIAQVPNRHKPRDTHNTIIFVKIIQVKMIHVHVSLCMKLLHWNLRIR